MKFKSEVQLEALSNATTDTDKFLVSDSSTVKYRTGAQLLSDLGIAGTYVPYTGATGNVDLGTHTLSSYNLIVNHTSGSGVAASITKGGNGEALTINKTSGSGNAMSVTGGLTSLVDLTLSSIANATIDTDRFIVSDGGAIKYRTGTQVLSDIGGQPALTNPVTGTGTTNYVSKFTGATTLGNSQIFDNGTNVGIGTTSPGYKLTVDGDVDVNNGAILAAQAYGINLGVSGYDIVMPTTTRIAIKSAASERISILNTGNVGIGTTSPGAKLEVQGTNTAGDLALSNSSTIVLSGDTLGKLAFRNYDGSFNFSTFSGEVASIRAVAAVDFTGLNGANTDLLFYTNSVSPANGSPVSGGSERMRISANGNVGIGTASPSYKLEVQGNFYANGTNGALTTANSQSNLYLLNLTRTSTSLITAGRVGIGTADPHSKLQVAGGIQMADDTDTASAAKVGTLKYRVSGNNSYVDMCMQTGAATYEWVNIVQNNW